MKILRLCTLLILWSLSSKAQRDTGTHLRVSLLTVGVGDEIYASFGHTGIRILDSVTGRDIVYNYGTFDGFQEGFEMKFMRGKLNYYISWEPFRDFMATYIQEQRKVEEQELLIPQDRKLAILHFLQENAKEENKNYKYDFLFDNCATRIRDVFPNSLGSGFKYGPTIPANSTKTYRQLINEYLAPLPWERLGINLLLGRPVDKVMTNEGIMFLPDYLRDGMRGAIWNGQLVAKPIVVLLPVDKATAPKLSYQVVGVMLLIALITIGGLFIPQLKVLGKIMSTLLLVVTGLLGCLILFMWLGTDHQTTHPNWNILWCLPTNLLVPFIGKKGKDRYAQIAIILIGISLVVHIAHIQQFPLADVWPLWVALAAVFGTVYWRRKLTPAS